MAAARAIAGIGSCGQVARPKDPSSQNRTDWVACGLPRKIRKLVTDSNMAESTTPHKISWVGASPRPDCDTPNTTAMATCAPRTLPTEIAQTPSDANAPSSRTAVAPTLAPDETPSRNGSASALRTRTCTTTPAVVRAAPTTAASRTRGSRICQTMMPATVLSGCPDSCSLTTCSTAAGLSPTDPRPTPATIVIRSKAAQAAITTGNGARSLRRPAARGGSGLTGSGLAGAALAGAALACAGGAAASVAPSGEDAGTPETANGSAAGNAGDAAWSSSWRTGVLRLFMEEDATRPS